MLTNTPKETLTSFQALLDIAQGVKALASNPDLDKLVKDAYALPEAEQSKADAARQAIADNQAVLASIRKEKSDLDLASSDLDKKKSDLEIANKSLDERSAALNKKEQDLGSIASDLREKATSLQKKEDSISIALSKQEKDKIDLENQWKEVRKYEADLKAKAEQLQALTKGL